MSGKKISLYKRMKPAYRGCYVNPSALLPKLEAAAAWPLKNLFDNDTLCDLQNECITLGIYDPLKTYQDAVNILSKYHPDPLTGKARVGFNPYKDYPDFVTNFILALINCCYNNELRRRMNNKDYVYVENARYFPGFSIPAPRLFQAGSLRCGDKPHAKRLAGAYQSEFLPLMNRFPNLKERVAKYLKKQTESVYFYDPVTLTMALSLVYNDCSLSLEDTINYCYDLFILPYQIWQKSYDSVSDSEENVPSAEPDPLNFYVKKGTELPISDVFQLVVRINELLRTDPDQKWTNEKTGDNLIVMSDIPYTFSDKNGRSRRDQLEKTLYSIMLCTLYGDVNATLKNSDLKNHLYEFCIYDAGKDGHVIDHSFTSEEMQELSDIFPQDQNVVPLALICHKDESENVEHIHVLFYFRSDEPISEISRIDEILS